MYAAEQSPSYTRDYPARPIRQASSSPRAAVELDAVRQVLREVIMRLPLHEPRGTTVRGWQAENLGVFCAALVSGDDTAAADARLCILAERGSPEARLNYLADAARMLGDWWMEDRVSFFDVTVGTGRIVAMLPDPANLTRPSGVATGLTVVFASVPGEQHTLGVRMATEQFRCDGWDVALRIGLTQDELVSEIERMPRCILGLSIGGKHALKPISDLAVALEKSCPNASIVVSGHDIEDIRPQLLSMGLSNIAHEIYEAKVKISALWDHEASARLD